MHQNINYNLFITEFKKLAEHVNYLYRNIPGELEYYGESLAIMHSGLQFKIKELEKECGIRVDTPSKHCHPNNFTSSPNSATMLLPLKEEEPANH